MNIPFSVIKGVSGSKSTALMALLAGLVIITVLKNTGVPASSTKPKPLA